jgi:DNA-binding beta-propeller fold protein YncE
LKIWSAQSGEPITNAKIKLDAGGSLLIVHGGHLLVSQETTSVIDAKTGRRIRTFGRAGLEHVECLAVSSDGTLVAAEVMDYEDGPTTVSIFTVATGDRTVIDLDVEALGQGSILGYPVTFTHSGKYLFVGDTIYDCATGESLVRGLSISTASKGILGESQPSIALFGLDDRTLLVGNGDMVAVYRLSGPKRWHGVFYLKEVWAAILFTLALLYSLLRDWKGLARGTHQ